VPAKLNVVEIHEALLLLIAISVPITSPANPNRISNSLILILTAMVLAKADPWTLRQKFSVVVEKTARQLAGTPCLELDEAELPKQEICCSRIFGKGLTELAPIKQGVATYVGRAAEKLRAKDQCASTCE